MVHHSAATGYDRAGDAYDRGRPTYPPEALDRLLDETRPDPDVPLLELGAGTGKLTADLLARGLHVVAVEPVAGMRARLAAVPGACLALEGTAEAIPLEDAAVDVALVAQAFHWFDGRRALAELHRVLRPAGRLGLVWNRRDERTPWVKRLTALVDPHEGEAPRYARGEWRAAFDETPLFEPLRHAAYEHAHALPPDGVVDRVASISFIASLPEEQRNIVLDDVRALLAGDPATAGKPVVALPYVTDVYWTERRAERAV